ncbi:c-type cytochrome [Bradyrhizobium sp. SEMIA]|uniref:c-type cytochrome n=1 Tax=Bradyrhizobium sp. SEMIA TaxID=2597515 RepID=UPI0018A3E718|nr:c-type cytochrome [Bradyrhizobium sp. SEMIA]QOG22998.1 c-type cytochrome [Bradyrhizobium sp. SEMIA]
MGHNPASPVIRVVIASLMASGLGACGQSKAAGPDNFDGDAHRGAKLIAHYQCGSCHEIPGIAGADGNVGPPLRRVGTRTYIAGFIQNSPDNMAYWIEDPQRMLPGNAMPGMGIPQNDARDIAAFLYTLN